MGQEHPKFDQFQQIHQFTYHPAMSMKSQIIVLKDSETNDKFLQYCLPVTSRQATKNWQQKIKQYFINVDTSLLYLPIRYHYKSSTFCGTAGIIKIYYQYYPSTLLRQINANLHLMKKFTQDQVWKILYTLCSAANSLHQKEKKLGQIGLQTIFLNNQKKSIKVATGLSFYSNMIIDQVISPQTIEQFSYNSKRINKKSVKHQQSFCIGVVILCVMLLMPKPPILSNITTNYQSLLVLFEQLKNDKSYSQQLKQIIKRMCNVNPSLRIMPQMIIKKLQWEKKNSTIKINPNEAAIQILKQSNQQYKRVQNNMRLTLGIQNFKSSADSDQLSSFSKNLKKSLEKTQSQYLPFQQNKQQIKENNYYQLLALVDRQLESSKKIFPSTNNPQ